MNPLLGPVCACGHGIGMHDIRKDGSRSACSVSTGPRGTACDCKTFTPAPDDLDAA